MELLGGYDKAFKERNPWKNISELTWKRDSLNRPDVSLPRISTGTQRDSAGATIDGFLIDMQGYYDYQSAPDFSMDPISLVRNGAVSLASGGIIRNSLILNAVDAVRANSGAIVENNVIVNSVRVAVTSRGGGDKDPPTIIRNNTIAFVWDPRVPGQGGTAGLAIDATNNAVIEGNLLMHADNSAVSVPAPGKVIFANNAFYRNLFSNVSFTIDGKASSLDDSDIDQVAEVGFKKADGNIAADPKLQFDGSWYDRFLKRTSGLGKRFTDAQWSETRKSAGLPDAGEKAKAFAPPYPPQAAIPLLTPKNTALSQGARIRPLPVALASAKITAPDKKYKKVALEAFAGDPKSYSGSAIEVIGGISGAANIEGVSQASRQTHKGSWLIDEKGNSRTLAVFAKGTNIERRIDATPNYGSGAPKDLFVIRGTALVKDGYPKHVLVIDSIETYEPPVITSQRPTGRE